MENFGTGEAYETERNAYMFAIIRYLIYVYVPRQGNFLSVNVYNKFVHICNGMKIWSNPVDIYEFDTQV